MESYKLERIRFPVRLDVLVDISVHHPLRYHREFFFIHRDTQKREHMRMTKSVPSHDLLAELLHRSVSILFHQDFANTLL